ncbi:hypothetical protein [Bradyrhizobium sp.]|uniref:hypothetical protein n=1 Tax=Bradyrhizobium sp. TaxID=376 RepID=UPI001ECD62A3|nr:hypothetical protein [Bradyrhizobium sp.]MBV9985228.1 hypothetical protein [Bradyrhizobium sp.]
MLLRFFQLALAAVLCAACLGVFTVRDASAVTADGQSRSDVIAKLRANPAQIFLDADGNTLTVAALISAVRDLVIADKAALTPIIAALNLASAGEKSAIGTALGQAAQALLKTDAPFAAEIQQALAESSDSVAILAFAGVTGNAPIGATGAAAGGVGGAAGSAGAGGAGGGGGGRGGTGSGSGGGGPNRAGLFSSGLTTPTTTNSTTVTNALTSVSP